MKKNLKKKTKLKIIKLKNIKMEKGNLVKFIEKKSQNYKGFGEVYFSNVKKNKVKAWKKHKKTYSNLTVICGKVKFLILDKDKKLKKFVLHSKSYKSILIPPNTFYGFMGIGEQNVICNFINKPHSIDEHINKNINYFQYKWV